MEAIVLDKDSTGRLWVTYTQNNQVYVNHSLGDDQTWGTPFVVPVNGATVSADDISGVVAFDSQIGVMWSNQVDDAMYFATHTDGDPDNVWQGSRTAIQGPKTADDHISIRSVQADDVSGRVFAVVKTSLGDLQNPSLNAPLMLLLVRDQAGNWTNYRFGRVIDHHTRPIVMIDQEHRNLYVFATHDENCGAIYYKKTPLSNISFSDGLGTPFIQSSTDTCINNATSTKQNVNSATGLPVLASDDTSKNYLHNIMDLGDVDTTAPTIGAVAPAEGTTGVAATANAEATFSEAMDPATTSSATFTLVKQGTSQAVAAQVSYDAATRKATLDPSADLDPSATYTATVKGGTNGVKDLAGNPLAQDKTWSFTTTAAATQTANLSSVADAGLSELAPNTNNGTAKSLKLDGNDPDPNGFDLYAALRWDLSQCSGPFD
ncbi:MAG: Ig-like domain-containing protein [Rubrobacteraceae bacterium]|nr:Ig-like domain-containing protein [Rubrobacteraceae bacterium]